MGRIGLGVWVSASFQKIMPSSVLRQQKWVLRPGGFVRGLTLAPCRLVVPPSQALARLFSGRSFAKADGCHTHALVMLKFIYDDEARNTARALLRYTY